MITKISPEGQSLFLQRGSEWFRISLSEFWSKFLKTLSSSCNSLLAFTVKGIKKVRKNIFITYLRTTKRFTVDYLNHNSLFNRELRWKKPLTNISSELFSRHHSQIKVHNTSLLEFPAFMESLTFIHNRFAFWGHVFVYLSSPMDL